MKYPSQKKNKDSNIGESLWEKETREKQPDNKKTKINYIARTVALPLWVSSNLLLDHGHVLSFDSFHHPTKKKRGNTKLIGKNSVKTNTGKTHTQNKRAINKKTPEKNKTNTHKTTH